MRIYPFAAAGVSLIAAALTVWQVVESSDDLDDAPQYFPAGTPVDGAVEVTVSTGMSPGDIGEALEEAGAITSGTQFNILVGLLAYDGVLQAGDYEFQPGTTALEALYRIRHGETSQRTVTVREGWRLEEIADALEEQGIPRLEFLDAASRARDFAPSASNREGFAFLQAAPRGASLEGYLYPATYSIRRSDTVQTVIEKMLQAFENNLTVSTATSADGVTFHEVVTLASIVEREAVVPEERPVIAQVFLSRLRRGMPLEADPTVQYAIAADAASVAEFGYWKQGLTLADLEVDSPYNTYQNPGIPPGPICNPRLESIEAVVHPATTTYLYFVAKGDGSHAFASTLEEHLENIERYQGGSEE